MRHGHDVEVKLTDYGDFYFIKYCKRCTSVLGVPRMGNIPPPSGCDIHDKEWRKMTDDLKREELAHLRSLLNK
jgi:hypothetical protein